jgi:homeobox protein YOX1/YHP1
VENNFTPPPISPTGPTEVSTIKKKRKRADANQLKVLNEVYARTAFPSTEERNALAKQLDMSPRSVQIW